MLQEYLFLNTEKQDVIKNYKPEGVEVHYVQWDNSTSWCVQYEIPGENESVAKRLSEIHCYVMKYYNPTILTNDSSAYFNKRLYPLISEFERKLRKLLYVTSALHPDEDSAKNISGLESKDFGTIFAMLFVDEGFMKVAKEQVKAKNKDTFTKAELLKLISMLDENTLWGSLLGRETVPTLQKDFVAVRDFRNDVMHSHDIDWERYNLSKKLYGTINKEMENAILLAFKTAQTQSVSDTFNGTLKTAIDRLSIADALQTFSDWASEYYRSPEYLQLREVMEKLTELYKPAPEVIALQETMEKLSEAFKPTPEMIALQDTMEKLAEAYKPTPEMIAFQDTIEKMQTSLISPEVQSTLEQFAEQQHKMSEMLKTNTTNAGNTI